MNNFQKLRVAKLSQIAASILFMLVFFSSSLTGPAQQKDKKEATQQAPTLTRTNVRHETRRFPYGSSLTIVGAPAGSITIEAWQKSEIDITAETELHANTEADLTLLAAVNGFTIDEDVNHLRILTTGTHDKIYMRRVAKKFPKTLLNLPWKIDFHIRVPPQCDVEIDAGRGAISISGVEGSLSLKALESDAELTLTGGAVNATIGAGSVKVNVPTRSWRGAGASIQLALGDMTVELPPGFSAEISADVLRNGQIENGYDGLVPQERTSFTPRSLRGRAGAGGASLSFKVTDGTLRIKKMVEK